MSFSKENVLKILQTAGYTPTTAATALGIGTQAIYTEINGNRCSRPVRQRLAELCGVEHSEMWGDEDLNDPPEVRARKEALRKAGYTQKMLAEKCKTGTNHVARTINGTESNYVVRVALAHLTGVHFVDLWGEQMKPPSIGQCRKLAECLRLYFCTGRMSFVTLSECGPQCRKNCDRGRLIEP
jgi:plasmid maintenance system antidote protein VapI